MERVSAEGCSRLRDPSVCFSTSQPLRGGSVRRSSGRSQPLSLGSGYSSQPEGPGVEVRPPGPEGTWSSPPCVSAWCWRGLGEGGGREAAISLGCSRSSLTWAQHHVEGPEKQRLWGDARVFLTAQQERNSGGSRVRFGETGRGSRVRGASYRSVHLSISHRRVCPSDQPGPVGSSPPSALV